MIVSTKNRKLIYQTLFREGALFAEKNHLLPSHPSFKDTGIRNVEVCKLMLSLKSRGFVEENFSWQHFYWTLTDAGIDYIRAFLNIPESQLPATKKANKKTDAPFGQQGGGFRGGNRRGNRSGRGFRGAFGSNAPTGDE